MKDKQRSLVGGISILGIAGLICKVVGVLYLIPLANLIGAQGLGVYNQIFPSYNLMLTISSAGIPVAISRMVAARLALGQTRNSARVFRVALIMLSALGLVSMLGMLLFSGQLAHATGTPESVHGFMMIAPSLLLVCVMSAFRGYMQGRRRMWPTAISQLIEQGGQGGALPLAYVFMRRGGYSWGVAGACWAPRWLRLQALLYMALDFFWMRNRLENTLQTELTPMEARRPIARELILTAVPITIGAVSCRWPAR